MKRLLSLILALMMLVSAVAMTACESTVKETEEPTEAPTEAPEVIPETPYPLDCLRIGGVDIDEFVIVSDTSLGGVMTTAATELQKYIELTCGKKLEIVEGTATAGTRRILIDGAERIPTDNDSWGVYTDADGLVLAGTAKRSALYAVYYFLEEYLDWRFFTSDCETVYEHSKIDLVDVDDTYTHQYKVRGLYTYDYSDPWISVKRYFNESSMRNLGPELGGMEGFTYMGIHNFWNLAGKDTEEGQPCLNDQQVLDNILNNTIAYLDANPGTPSVHISQEDNNQYCQCEDCLKDIEYYGAPSGTIIEMLNYVCEGLEDYNGGIYKDVLVITFAYRWSFDAPDNIVCHDNIVIEYTLIDQCQQHSLTDPACNHIEEDLVRHNAGIIEQINKWAKISKQCLVYDYGLNCRYYYSPFPDFDVLRENYAYYATLNPWGYMNLCNPHQNGCDFSEMRFYLYAKLLQNPNMTEEEYNRHIDEFIAAYYGDAAPYIKEYFEFTQKAADDFDGCYSFYSSPEEMFGEKTFGLASDFLVDTFSKALEAVADDEASLTRVRRLWVGMEYLRLGDVFDSIVYSKDEERMEAAYASVEHFWNEVIDLDLKWVWESGTIPDRIGFKKNPRKLIPWLHHFKGYKEL